VTSYHGVATEAGNSACHLRAPDVPCLISRYTHFRYCI